MSYENVLFNGKSMRNAIIAKLAEDKHLTSALFANSNITILIDILSYMYQCLMSNLRQAANESMWSDTMFFENATRLAKMIGYYAKGQLPYTILAKLSNTNNFPDFGRVHLGFGPYEYDFAVVEHNVNNDQSIVRLALGDWRQVQEPFVSDGTKYQEFIIEKNVDKENNEYENSVYISQKYMRVFSKKGDEPAIEWKYSADPLFLLQNPEYNNLDAEEPRRSRSLIANTNLQETRLYNFYINENGDYVLKFGDGLSTDIPENGSNIYVFYVTSIETDLTISSAAKIAITNASESKIYPSFDSTKPGNIYELLHLPAGNTSDGNSLSISCIPITKLGGYRDKESANTIREYSQSSFSRQNRLVTKNDYRSYLLENYPEWEDVTVQNNWEYISSFYGWLYSINKELINVNNLEKFNSSDLADANNVYIWVLNKDEIEINQAERPNFGVGIITDLMTGMNEGKSGLSIGAIKDITEHPIFLHALCKRFAPYANDVINNIINYSSPNPFDPSKYLSCFRIHVDSNYSNRLNIIKAKTYDYFKSYLFDNIKLGSTPNVAALIKDLMNIDGIINITTVFNVLDENGKSNIATEIEVNGMKFCTWTDTNNELLVASDDAAIAFNLPNIPNFQYFKAAQTYQDFINHSIEFKVDYSIKS